MPSGVVTRAASLKVSLARFGSFILKLMRYTIHLVRRGPTGVIAYLVRRLQLLKFMPIYDMMRL
jgi:hypothetical protein